MKIYDSIEGNNFDNCSMCKVSSEKVPLVINPGYFITGKKAIILSHEGKMICCDCLHDELVVLADEEK